MEQAPTVFDCKGLLLIGGLSLIIFLPLDFTVEWAADRWDVTMLQARYRQADIGTLLAFVLSVAIASWLSGALSLRAPKQPTKLDSEPPLP